jgi:hypothetical protein
MCSGESLATELNVFEVRIVAHAATKPRVAESSCHQLDQFHPPYHYATFP